jgi:hypothetical protein
MSGCGTSPKCQEQRVTAAYWLKPDKLAFDGLGPDLTRSRHRRPSGRLKSLFPEPRSLTSAADRRTMAAA